MATDDRPHRRDMDSVRRRQLLLEGAVPVPPDELSLLSVPQGGQAAS
jgi:hypothetical protein